MVDKLGVDQKLKLYAMGQQAKNGDNTGAKPGAFALKEKKKWEAYEAIKGTNQDDAKREFMKMARELLGEWPGLPEVTSYS